MKRIFCFVLLIALALEQSSIKRSVRSKHGQDCISDSACEEGLVCKIYRCFTKFESKNLKELGLYDKDLCSLKKKCPTNKKCVKHRCVDINTPIEYPSKRTGNIDDVHLLFTGNIVLNKKPFLSGIKNKNEINYDHLFTHITKNIKNADLSFVPLSSTFYIESEGKKNVRNGNIVPKELGDAIANAGFNVVLHASSQAYSQKKKGITNTLNFWKTKYPDIHPLGISSTLEEAEKNYYILTKNNIKIGIINYSVFLAKSIPQKEKFMINIINQKKVEETVQKLRPQVDFLIVCMNWGEKTGFTPNKNQIVWSKTLAGLGVNLIVGNRPSNVQPVSFVKNKNGNTALVFFSLGHLVGDNKSKPKTLGALANVVISKENGKVSISSYNLIPTINHQGESNKYQVYKLLDYNESLGEEVHKKFNMEKVHQNCHKAMGPFALCG